MSIGQELLNVPMGDMIRQMAFAIAEGQVKLDASSIEVAMMMGGLRVVRDGTTGKIAFDDSRIFFGYEMMTPAQAEAYIAADEALSGGDVAEMMKSLRESSLGKAPDQNASDEVKKKYNESAIRVPTRLSMLELGFTPTFYQFIDTIIEVKIAIKITDTTERSVRKIDSKTTTNWSAHSGGLFGEIFGSSRGSDSTVTTSQVDASYSNRYGYSAEGASLLRTKLAPVPPPAVLEERVRLQMEADAKRRNQKLEEPKT